MGTPLFPSELIEPTAAALLGHLYAKCDAAKGDAHRMMDACANLWMGLQGLQKISVALPEATHFGVALSNNIVKAARYIEEHTRIRPLDQWKW